MNTIVYIFEFSKLLSSAEKQSKCAEIIKDMNVNRMHTQKYLLTGNMSVEEQQLLFKLRSKTINDNLNLSYL